MAFTTVYLTNGIEIKKAPIGYSWTTLFFGPFPALFRQDWLWALGLFFGNLLTYGIVGLVVSFFYNKAYLKGLFNSGYKIHNMGGMTDESLKNYLGFLTIPKSTDAGSL